MDPAAFERQVSVIANPGRRAVRDVQFLNHDRMALATVKIAKFVAASADRWMERILGPGPMIVYSASRGGRARSREMVNGA